MTTVAYIGSTGDPYPPSRFDTVGHGTGGTVVVPPRIAPAGSVAPASAAATRPAGPDSAGPAARLLAGGTVVLAGAAVLVILAARSAGDGR